MLQLLAYSHGIPLLQQLEGLSVIVFTVHSLFSVFDIFLTLQMFVYQPFKELKGWNSEYKLIIPKSVTETYLMALRPYWIFLFRSRPQELVLATCILFCKIHFVSSVTNTFYQIIYQFRDLFYLFFILIITGHLEISSVDKN